MSGIKDALSGALTRARLEASFVPFVDRPGRVIDDEIDALAEHNLGALEAGAFGRSGAAFRDLNESFLNVFIVEIRGYAIRIWPKAAFFMGGPDAARYRAMRRECRFRAALYRRVIEHALRRRSITLRTTFALDTGDIGLQTAPVPLMCFQKIAGCRNILVPDVDFFLKGWYKNEIDRAPYDQKAIRAGFVGASTGGVCDVAAIRELSIPRLRSAAHFVGNRRVSFAIARAAQCADPAAETLLKRQPYFVARRSWSRQRQDRFLLSMDGNGATASRVAIALKSQCVLVRYTSPFRLFYFDRLVEGRDYLEIRDDGDIETILDREEASPGTYRAVAEAGTTFFERFLTKGRVLDYTAALLSRYAATVGALPSGRVD